MIIITIRYSSLPHCPHSNHSNELDRSLHSPPPRKTWPHTCDNEELTTLWERESSLCWASLLPSMIDLSSGISRCQPLSCHQHSSIVPWTIHPCGPSPSKPHPCQGNRKTPVFRSETIRFTAIAHFLKERARQETPAYRLLELLRSLDTRPPTTNHRPTP